MIYVLEQMQVLSGFEVAANLKPSYDMAGNLRPSYDMAASGG